MDLARALPVGKPCSRTGHDGGPIGRAGARFAVRRGGGRAGPRSSAWHDRCTRTAIKCCRGGHGPCAGQRRCGIRFLAVPTRKPRRARSSTFRSEEHTSELQSLMRISYAVFCLKKQNIKKNPQQYNSIYIKI